MSGELKYVRYRGQGIPRPTVEAGTLLISPAFGPDGLLAYLPGKRIVGLSKLARLVDCFALRFQVQERMTREIADAMTENLNPRGVAVLVHGNHTCMTARGVLKPGSVMTTSEMRGAFRSTASARSEVLRLLDPQ